jgi:hypothetical protein
MKIFRTVLFAAALTMGTACPASVHETVPAWHWAYPAIEALQDRGLLPALSRLNRPHTRGEIAAALAAVDEARLDANERGLAERLRAEFPAEPAGPDTDRRMAAGVHGMGLVQGGSEGDKGFKGVLRSRIAVPAGNRVVLVNAMNLDGTRVDDPSYTGKKWRGMVYYTEQAYAAAGWKNARLRFGRDFMRWGPGREGTLFLSDACRPMDLFSGSVGLGPFRYSFLAGSLDPRVRPATPGDTATGPGETESRTFRRYLSAHRLNARLFKGRLELAAAEAVLYGGAGKPFDWAYANPFVVYHGEQLNRSEGGNTLGSLDLWAEPLRGWQVYGSILVDDIQVEKKVVDDLEPDEIAWQAGTVLADPLGLSGMTLHAEAVRVANRTYKTPAPWETYVYYNEPIGHPLGNDADRWTAGMHQWVGGRFRLGLALDRTRRGEGSLFSEWDAPWRERTLEQGYKEPFPTGVVETESRFRVSLDYRSSALWGMSAELWTMETKNAGHAEGLNTSRTAWFVRLWADWDKYLAFD